MAETVTEKTGLWKMRTFCFNAMTALGRRQKLNWVPDKLYLKVQYFLKLGRRLNLKRPTLYNEKLQWIKLYDRDERYKVYVDKLAVRDYVRQRVGEKYLIPEIARWDRAEDIQWDELPERFALKCTHGSSCNILCADRASLDVAQARRRIDGWMKRDWFWLSREWPYKGVKPRILIEEFLEGPNGQSPYDYKILCFGGEPRYIIVDVDRYTDHKRNFYSPDWVRQDMFNRHPGYDGPVQRPEGLEEMLEVARKLASGIRHIRIDLYNVGGRVYFGEMTFFHGFGMEVFRPRAFEQRLGEMIDIGGGR